MSHENVPSHKYSHYSLPASLRPCAQLMGTCASTDGEPALQSKGLHWSPDPAIKVFETADRVRRLLHLQYE